MTKTYVEMCLFVSYSASREMTSCWSFHVISLEYNKSHVSSWIELVYALNCKSIYELAYKCETSPLAVFPYEALVPTFVWDDLYLP